MYGIKKLLTANSLLSNTLTYVQMREWKTSFQNFNDILEKNLFRDGIFNFIKKNL